MSLEEKLQTFGKYYDLLDKQRIQTIHRTQIQHGDSDLKKFQSSIYLYESFNEMSEEAKELLLMKKTISIDDIKNHMIKKVKECLEGFPTDKDELEEYDQDNRDSGYAGSDEVYGILDFWENLDDNGVLSVYEDQVTDRYEIDLNGHRLYLLQHSLGNLYVDCYVKQKGLKSRNENSSYREYEKLVVPKNEMEFLDTVFRLENYSENWIISRFNSLLDNAINVLKESKHQSEHVEKLSKMKL